MDIWIKIRKRLKLLYQKILLKKMGHFLNLKKTRMKNWNKKKKFQKSKNLFKNSNFLGTVRMNLRITLIVMVQA